MRQTSSINRATRTAQAEHAVDKVREKFGKAAVVKGLVFDGAIEDDEDEETTTSRPRSLCGVSDRLVAQAANG